jgi:hypothetical protein
MFTTPWAFILLNSNQFELTFPHSTQFIHTRDLEMLQESNREYLSGGQPVMHAFGGVPS